MTNDYAIRTRQLCRYYGSREVVSSLDLAIPRGQIYGLVGRNGAGKSTTIRMLLGLVEPTRGSAEVLGDDSCNLRPETKARIGYLAESHYVDEWMTVKRCGEYYSAFYPKWNDKIFQAALDYFSLSPKAMAKKLSRGERAALCLALALAPEPELLIMDDPALGLDPVSRRMLLQAMVHVTQKADRTILFSSHMLTDVERVADRIAVLDRGVLRADCTIDTFQERVQQYALRFDGAPPAVDFPGLVQTVHADGELLVVLVDNGEQTAADLRRLNAVSMRRVPLTLEDAFTAYLGERGDRTFFLKTLEAQ